MPNISVAQINWNTDNASENLADAAVNQFLAPVRKEQFQRKYFAEVNLNSIAAICASGASALRVRSSAKRSPLKQTAIP